jgi:uncharacterized protein YwgA
MEGLLALVRAFGGRIESRLRIQKSAYLLKLLGAKEFKGIPFRYHYYGPYSRELSGSLQQAVAGAFVDEQKHPLPFDDLRRYSYTLTDGGRDWLEGFSSDVEERFTDEIPLLREAHLKTLELAGTIAFLQREESLDLDSAVRRALKLKPDCTAYREPAEKLLRDLGL